MAPLGQSLLHLAFRIVARRNRADLPTQLPGAQPFDVTSKDGTAIHGWHWKTGGTPSRGTVFILHGFTEHCVKKHYQKWALRIREKHGVDLAAFDLRMHGRSGKKFPTFGAAESWDFKAVLDYAEESNWPKPYVALGVSLGAMTAQRTIIEDARLSGAVLIAPPGWPVDAIAKVGQRLIFTRAFCRWLSNINGAYGFDILNDGDRRAHPCSPAHNPRILYIIGDQDFYGWEPAHEVFKHWYPDAPLELNVSPKTKPDALKWFVQAKGFNHPGPFRNSLFTWEPLDGFVDEGLEVMLTKTGS
jgi:pimeloyl-ACP methyl ester carboxylesterase